MALDRAKLKIKEKSLSAEQKMIRLEEKKHKWRMRALRAKNTTRTYVTDTTELRQHRLELRREIRSSHIANGFLRGRTYREIENFSWTQPDWKRIQRLIEKYSGEEPQVALQRLSQWMDGALNGVAPYMVERDERQPGSRRVIEDPWVQSQMSA